MRVLTISVGILFVIVAALALTMGWLSHDVVHEDDVAELSGPAGFNCWDLDMDRENDPIEDSNGDGRWDTADCRGSQGETGPAGPMGPKGDRGLTGARGPRGLQGEPGVCPDCPVVTPTPTPVPPPVVTPAPTPRRPRIIINRSVHVDAPRGRVRVEAPVTIQGDGVEFNGDVTTNSRSATVVAPIVSH